MRGFERVAVPLEGSVRGRPPRAGLTILLPARNERLGIRSTLAALPLHDLDAAGFDAGVLVVDGHSTDGTAEVARAWGARVVTQEGRGKGLAFRTALLVLDTDFVVMLDADHTYPEDRIPEFARRLHAGADVVMGSRLGGEMEEGAMGAVNRLGNHSLSAIATVLYGRRVTDLCTGMWGFRRHALARLPLRARGFEIEAELFGLAARAGLRIEEVPIDYACRVGETKLGRLRDGFAIARALVASRSRRDRFLRGSRLPAPEGPWVS